MRCARLRAWRSRPLALARPRIAMRAPPDPQCASAECRRVVRGRSIMAKPAAKPSAKPTKLISKPKAKPAAKPKAKKPAAKKA